MTWSLPASENKSQSESSITKHSIEFFKVTTKSEEENSDNVHTDQGQSVGGKGYKLTAVTHARLKRGVAGIKKRFEQTRTLNVSGQSPVKQVAGAISWISRGGECPRLLATQSAAVNQAAKAVAIARKFLEDDNIDIACYPMFTPGRRRQDESFTFLLQKINRWSNVGRNDGSQELKVSKLSNPGTVAGAIAARVREGQRVVLSSIGARSVSKAICSIVIARQYLAEDGVDISCRPSFLNIEFEDGRRSSCLQFKLLAQQI